MARISTAFRAFFGSLFNADTAAKLTAALNSETALLTETPKPAAPAETPKPKPPVEPPPARSDAVTVLAALQREARLIDFVKEPLTALSDQQIGAAVRDIHQNLATAIDRLFSVQPLRSEDEGTAVTVPKGFDAGEYQLVGNVAGDPPFNGTLTHHGWKVGQLNVPKWSGSKSAANVIAPAEVELK